MEEKKILVKTNITYEELSELLQTYLDAGDVLVAMEYCEALKKANNPYGYLFQGFIYEEGSGSVVCNLEKALWCYEKAKEFGIDVEKDILLLKNKIQKG